MEKETFAPASFALSVVTAVFGTCILGQNILFAPRATLVWGFLQAVALAVICALCAMGFSDSIGRWLGVPLALWFAWELVQTVAQAQTLCRQQFSSSAALGAAPLLFWLGWRLTAAQLDRTARVLWWLLVCGALICALGLGGQLHWQRIVEEEETPLALPPVYAEYFALPLLCARRDRRRACALPFCAFAVQAGFALGFALLFGTAQRGYESAEFLRALSVGVFSRPDALLLFLWLLAALFRICFLCAVIHALCRRLAPPRHVKERPC